MLYMAGTFLIYLLCVHRIIQSYVGEATKHSNGTWARARAAVGSEEVRGRNAN